MKLPGDIHSFKVTVSHILQISMHCRHQIPLVSLLISFPDVCSLSPPKTPLFVHFPHGCLLSCISTYLYIWLWVFLFLPLCILFKTLRFARLLPGTFLTDLVRYMTIFHQEACHVEHGPKILMVSEDSNFLLGCWLPRFYFLLWYLNRQQEGWLEVPLMPLNSLVTSPKAS